MKILAIVANISAALFVVSPLVNAHADSWQYEAKIETQEFSFGPIRIVQKLDATQNQTYPDFLLTIYNVGSEVGRYPGLAFRTFYASPDNHIFVGLSNGGIPGSAVIVFDSSGVISVLAKHGVAQFDYCDTSVSIIRTWYDKDNPDVEFKLDGNPSEQGIYLRSCRGTRIELLKTVAEAYARKAEYMKTKE